jgi:CheY-like chemotaxis protein
LGEGSEFVVRLPRVQTAELPPSPAETTKLSGPSLRVMVVDDNIDTADFLVTLLEASGHDVRMAHDGPSSLKAALAFQPDVVLLDIGLPGLDGFEVAKRLRQQTALNGIVLVAMTGYGQESDRQRSLDAGFNHHLVKPTAFSKVQQILATVSQKAT